jgi:SAM-dependent methyltransferase
MTYHADAAYWDRYSRKLRQAGDDLDWEGRWTDPFLAPLRQVAAQTVLELGCGTGNDAARLAAEGYAVTAIDLSAGAIAQARAKIGAKLGSQLQFLAADMTSPLGFPDGNFGAVISNVALYMVPDRLTRLVFAEVARRP